MLLRSVLTCQGIWYFGSHKELWKPLTEKSTPTLTTTVSVTCFMFIFTYVPQAAVLAFLNGPLAVVSAVFIVLSESSTITNLISRRFFVEDALFDTFDAVSSPPPPFPPTPFLSPPNP